MTLIAGMSVGGLPAFVGDLLLSWRVPSAVDLPTQADLKVRPGLNGDNAAGLAQKLVIIRPYVMLAWAGEHAEAVRIICELDDILPSTAAELHDLDLMFSILNTCRVGTELVALLIRRASIYPFGVHTRGFELNGKRIYLLGTGASDFFEYLQGHPNILPDQERTDSLVAQAILLRFAARAFALQWVTGAGLSTSWGGGFEVAFPGEDGFRKIENLICRAWMIDEKGKYHNSGRSFFLRYYGNDLFLSCFNPGEKAYIVRSPIGRRCIVPQYEEVHPDWTLDVFVLKANGSFVEFARFQPPERQPVIDRVQLKKGAVSGWVMDQEYVDRCAKMAIAESSNGIVQFRMIRY
jgi:hypothetical protein